MFKSLLIFSVLLLSFSSFASAQFHKSETARKAFEKMSKGDQAGAIAILDKAIAQRKDLLEAHKMRGDLRVRTGDLDGGIADFSVVLELEPNNVAYYDRRATFRAFKRDYDGAISDYNAAIANGGKSERIYAARAGIKRDKNDMEGAIADFQTALAIKPSYAAAHIGLSMVYEWTGNIDQAIYQLKNFHAEYENKRDGKLPVLRSGQPQGESTLIAREGKEPNGSQVILATSEMKSFTANSPEEAERKVANREQLMNVSMSYLNLGRLYAGKGDLDLALECYEKGLAITKDDAYAYRLRSEVRIKKGDLRGAIEDLTIVANDPAGAPDIHLNKALLLTLQGKDAEAEKEILLHLQRFPVNRAGIDKRIDEAKKVRLQASPQ